MSTDNNSTGLAPLLKPEGATISDRYIVVFKENLEDSEDLRLRKKGRGNILSLANFVASSRQTVAGIIQAAGGKNVIRNEYNIGSSFRGFSATLDEDTLTKIRSLPFVKYVESDGVVSVAD